jgi:hypothetical protein
VQIPGEAARIGASQLQLAVRESGALRDLVLGYNELMLAETQQCVACNALHYLEARLCRWLLHCQDCVDSDTIPLTQELLGQMLGVRRTTLTVVARLLQTSGMIRYRRGVIHIVDRAKLEHTVLRGGQAAYRQAFPNLAAASRHVRTLAEQNGTARPTEILPPACPQLELSYVTLLSNRSTCSCSCACKYGLDKRGILSK